MKEIPIFFAIDNNYSALITVAIKSIMENCSKDYDYKCIILYQDLNEKDKDVIQGLEKNHFKIEFVSMDKGLETITNRTENKLRCDYFTLTIFYRLFIADMFLEYDKAIYIDSDIVVPGDISELYNVDLEGNLIGACTDFSIQEIKELMHYVENAVGVPGKQYINSGILVMDLKQLREKQFSQRFLELLNTYHFDSIAPDQDYINAICHGKIKYLNEEWDAMPNDAKEELKNPKLIHYNLFQKPWCYDSIQYADYFWKYAKLTPYYEKLCKFKENYSDEQKKSDADCLGVLIKKGEEIPNNEITFKKMYEKGVKIRL